MTAKTVMAVYRPKTPQRRSELEQLVTEHWPVLAQQGLVTARRPLIMRAADGCVVEVFEWRSEDAARAAHDDPVVQALWDRFAALCEFVPLSDLAEADRPFAEFTALGGAA